MAACSKADEARKLASCGPPSASIPAPADVLVPADFVATASTPAGSARRIEGYTGLTPVQVRRFYEGTVGVRISHAEDEVVDADLLLTYQGTRMSIKAGTSCPGRSRLSVLVGPPS